MKKLLVIVSILLLGGIGYFTYFKWVKQANLTNWSFVPQNALMVYESPAPIPTLEETRETSIWKNVSSLPLFAEIHSDLDVLDTLAGKGNFRSLFKEINTLISLHPISSDQFDFLFVLEIDNLSKHAYVSKALSHFEKNGFNKKTREYHGFTITELKNIDTQKVFTFIFYKNFFIGSFSAFLVEDAIRTISEETIPSFEKKYPELQRVSKLEKDEGNIYLNFSRFPAMLNAMLKTNTEHSPAKSAFLDLKIKDQNINLSGFTFLDEPTEFLGLFTQKPGATFDMAEVIPIETAWAHHINISDPTALASKLETYLRITDPNTLTQRQQLKEKYEFDVTYTFQLIDEEIGLINLEPMRFTQNNRFLILEIKDMGECLKFFNSVGEREAASKGDTVYVENFGNYEIRKLPISEFPQALLGTFASGFKNTYYLQHRNYLVFSNNLLQLKNFTIAIGNEDTWGKSLRIKKMLDQANQSANFSLFINTPRAWEQAVEKLKGSWEQFAREYQFPLRNLEFISLQFSAVDNKFYTNFTAHQPFVPSGTIPNKVKVLESVNLTDYIISKPHLVTNHNTREREIIVQDSSYTLHQFSAGFDIQWSKSIGEKIISDIAQIDYYKNGKLQIAFATAGGVHVIDRTGEYVAGFPRDIPGERNIAHFSVIDYDNTQNYRYGISDIRGNVYLTDKDVKPLGDWDPLSFDAPLTQPLQHFRIGRKDVMLAVLENGKVNLLNRRGQQMEKFPINLDTNLDGEFFIKETNDLGTTSVNLVTETGEFMELSFAGNLINREQLYKPSANTNFSVVNDITSESYIIVKNTERRYEVLNDAGEKLFEKDYFTDKRLSIQYYRLGGGINYVVFVDSGGTYLYIYDLSGKLVTGRPITSSTPISLLKYDNEYRIYRCVDKNLELISLSF